MGMRADLELYTKQGSWPLMNCVVMNTCNLQIAEHLLASRADVNTTCMPGSLMRAVFRGFEWKCWLDRAGANPAFKAMQHGEGSTALHWAAFTGNAACTTILLLARADTMA